MTKITVPELISSLGREEFPRSRLVEILLQRGYRRPDDAIASLTAKGIIERVTREWFLLGPLWRRRSIHKRWLANQLLLPSTLSLEYALQFHGLIPESVEVFTSVTPLRSREYRSPTGTFTYIRIPEEAFCLGRTVATLPDSTGKSERFFIASPEKALADKIWLENLPSPVDWETYLIDDLRLDEDFWSKAKIDEILRFGKAYRSRKVTSLATFFRLCDGRRKSHGRPRGGGNAHAL
jgi:hypothetical protein